MLDEILDYLVKPILRVVMYFLRGLLFVGWDLFVETVGWTVGWWFYRTITFGNFPTEKWEERENTSAVSALFIEFTGLGILASLAYFLSKLI